MWLSSKSLGPPIWPEGVQDTQSKTWHLPIIRRILIYRLQLTPILLLHRKQSKVEKMQKTQHPAKSSFHHGGKIQVCSCLFGSIAQCFAVRRRQLYSPLVHVAHGSTSYFGAYIRPNS